MNFPSILRPTLLAAVITLATGAPLSSCKKDVVLKTIDVKLTTNLAVDVKGNDMLAGSWSQELDPNANVDVRENRKKIKKVVVERLTYRVNQFIGTAGTTGSGTWKFYLSNDSTQVYTLSTVNDLDFQALDDSDTTLDLPIAEETKTKIVDAVNNSHKVIFVFDGSVTEKPSYARFEMQIYTKIDVGI